MSEPTGPQPKAVYLRRRVMAAAGSALAVLLLVWAVGALLGGGSRATGSAATPAADVGAVQSDSAAPPITIPPRASTTTSSSATSPPSSVSAPAQSGGSPTSATSSALPPPPPPGPPQPCPDGTIKVTASVARPSYRVGERPVFTLSVTNAGPLACTRDVSRPLRSLIVIPAGSPAGPQHLWSSADCYTVASPADVITLRPGQQVGYSVSWAGRTSAAGCPVARRTVPAGRYAVIGRLGTLASAPVPFTLTG